MKQVLLTVFVLFAGIATWAQAPNAFNYQGVARNGSGVPLASTTIGLLISIRDGSGTGGIVYQEKHSPTTNTFGLYNVSVGNGSVLIGTFGSISWGAGAKYMQVEIDPAGGTSYTLAGNSQLLSVPYAIYAANGGGGTTYSGGTGINVVGTTINAQNATALWNANELQGNNVSSATPTSGQGLVWSGSAWAPTALPGTTYTSGTGINIVGSVVNAQNTTALWNANELQGNNVSTSVPTSGQVLTWSGSAWTPTTVTSTTSVTMGGDVTGLSSGCTVAKIQGNPISAIKTK